MNFNCFLNLNLLFYIFLFILEGSYGQECSFDGVNCISCTEYQNCSGGVPQGRVISCEIGDSCTDDQLKQCQMKLNCYAQNECTQAGIFPDDLVDSAYYVCLNDASSGFLKYEFTCPEGNFFDKASLTCVSRDVTGAETEVPTSSSVSTSTNSVPTSYDPSSSTSMDPTSSPSSTDPSSSTTVDPLDPTTDLSSTSVDPTSSPTSTDPTSTITSSTSSTSISPTPPSTPTPSPTPSPTSAPFACMASGIFPNPDNCKMYFRCSTSLKAFYYICPGNSYFNEVILKCSMIITPSCQEQILKNSTTTLLPSSPATTTATPVTTSTTISSTSTTTTTTPTPTTTSTTTTATTTTTQSPITTTTTPSPSTPFSCPMTGIFENPSDCKSYYRCALSGQIFQYVCPGNTYFNEFTKRCSLLITPRCKKLIQG